MLTAFVQLGAGFIILAIGGHYIVRGAVSIAFLAKISTAVVGLTVVAFGTSLPELAVSVNAAAAGSTAIAYANVVGSNIFNIAVILAGAALVKPVLISRNTRLLEHPGMFAVLVLFLFMARDGLMSRIDGAVLLFGLVLFIVLTVLHTRAAGPADHSSRKAEIEGLHPDGGNRGRAWGLGIAYVVAGIVGLWIGAEFLVKGAVTIAKSMGVSERVIGLTIIAMGTSLPELVTSIVAARRGEHEIALSNLMGSNLFNVLAVLGLTSFVFAVPVDPRAISLDNWVMLGFGAALFPSLWLSKHVTGVHGALLLAAFGVYFVVVLGGGG